MSLRSLERLIIREAREVFCNKKLRVMDLMEWSTGLLRPDDGEVMLFLPATRVYVCIKKELDKR